jgi:hypothetical protein
MSRIVSKDANHLRPGLDDRVELVPLADKAIAALARFDQGALAETLQWTGSHASMRRDEIRLPANLRAIANYVVRRHRSLSHAGPNMPILRVMLGRRFQHGGERQHLVLLQIAERDDVRTGLL